MVNLRARIVFEATRRGLIVPEEMALLDQECLSWIGKALETQSPPSPDQDNPIDCSGADD
jgi:hypothetical protein